MLLFVYLNRRCSKHYEWASFASNNKTKSIVLNALRIYTSRLKYLRNTGCASVFFWHSTQQLIFGVATADVKLWPRAQPHVLTSALPQNTPLSPSLSIYTCVQISLSRSSMQRDWLLVFVYYKLFWRSVKGHYRTSLVFNGVVPVHASCSHRYGGFTHANSLNSRYAMFAWYFTASDCSRRRAVDTGLTSADRKPVADEGKSFEARQLRTVSIIVFLISVDIVIVTCCSFVSEEEPKSLVSVRVAGLPVSTRSNGVVRPLSPNAPVAAPPTAAAPAPVAHPAPEPAPAPASFLDFVQEHSRPRTTSNSHGYVVLVLPVSETAGGFAFACSVAAAASTAIRAVTTSLAHNDRDYKPP